jgi:hypothetical protein
MRAKDAFLISASGTSPSPWSIADCDGHIPIGTEARSREPAAEPLVRGQPTAVRQVLELGHAEWQVPGQVPDGKQGDDSVGRAIWKPNSVYVAKIETSGYAMCHDWQ